MYSNDATITPVVSSFRAMATSVIATFCSTTCNSKSAESLKKIKAVFSETEKTCSRFDPNSDLSRLNQSPEIWNSVSELCFAAIRESFYAYHATDGLFDPRVLSDLILLGYRESWTKGCPDPKRAKEDSPARPQLDEWMPEFNEIGAVLAGRYPLDLGGIGKGLALRWAASSVRSEESNFLIEAGGDCIAVGEGPTGRGWNIGVQNPLIPDGDPLIVLSLVDSAVCTSSTAVRSWWQTGKLRHHLIDPSTGEPGGHGLSAVTVVREDPAEAEVWSKSLFLRGKDAIREFSEQRKIAAAWITENGDVLTNSLIDPLVIWTQKAI